MIILLALAASHPASLSQTAQSRRSMPQISTEQLDRYAAVLVQIIELQRTARARQAMMPAEQAPLLKRQLAQGIAQALQRAGLEPAEFNRITSQVDSDPGTRSLLHQRMMKAAVGI